MHPISLIYTTFENHNSAQTICTTLLNENLIACANILPKGFSIYKWEEKILVNEQETFCLLKTSTEKVDTLKKRFLELHSYDCPCFVELPSGANTHEAFAQWVDAEVAIDSSPNN